MKNDLGSMSEEKRHYDAPKLQEQDEMIFPQEVMEKISNNNWCFGCSNCNCN